MKLSDEAVLGYLAKHPDFLERYKDKLAEHQIVLPAISPEPASPDNVIDVTDKIASRAREEARKAKAANQSLITVAAENMLHWQEMHLATLGFLACNNLRSFAQMVDEELPLIFGLAGSRLIMASEHAIDDAEALGFLVLPSDEIDELCQSETIYMGPPPKAGIALFSTPSASMAIMRLPDQLGSPVDGCALILQGRNADSFGDGKGQTLLLHLAEIVGVCLLSLIEAEQK